MNATQRDPKVTERLIDALAQLAVARDNWEAPLWVQKAMNESRRGDRESTQRALTVAAIRCELAGVTMPQGREMQDRIIATLTEGGVR